MFRASRKLGGLVVGEVDPMTIPGGELARLVDGLVAVLAPPALVSGEMQTIRSQKA